MAWHALVGQPQLQLAQSLLAQPQRCRGTFAGQATTIMVLFPSHALHEPLADDKSPVSLMLLLYLGCLSTRYLPTRYLPTDYGLILARGEL